MTTIVIIITMTALDITQSMFLNTIKSTHQIDIMNMLDFLIQMSDITGIF